MSKAGTIQTVTNQLSCSTAIQKYQTDFKITKYIYILVLFQKLCQFVSIDIVLRITMYLFNTCNKYVIIAIVPVLLVRQSI